MNYFYTVMLLFLMSITPSRASENLMTSLHQCLLNQDNDLASVRAQEETLAQLNAENQKFYAELLNGKSRLNQISEIFSHSLNYDSKNGRFHPESQTSDYSKSVAYLERSKSLSAAATILSEIYNKNIKTEEVLKKFEMKFDPEDNYNQGIVHNITHNIVSNQKRIDQITARLAFYGEKVEVRNCGNEIGGLIRNTPVRHPVETSLVEEAPF